MNSDINLEHRASSSQGKHEGEPSLGLCDRLDRTRDNSQRQLPTDHDYAVPTREYQTDQSSLKLLRLLLALSSGKENVNYQNNPTDLAQLTRSLHIRSMRSPKRARGRSSGSASACSDANDFAPPRPALRNGSGATELNLEEAEPIRILKKEGKESLLLFSLTKHVCNCCPEDNSIYLWIFSPNQIGAVSSARLADTAYTDRVLRP